MYNSSQESKNFKEVLINCTYIIFPISREPDIYRNCLNARDFPKFHLVAVVILVVVVVVSHFSPSWLIVVVAEQCLARSLNNRDTFTIDNRLSDSRAFSRELTLELSSNFRLSDTVRRAGVLRKRYSLALYSRVSRAVKLDTFIGCWSNLAWPTACWMLGLSIYEMEVSALDISGRVSIIPE